MFYGQNRLLLLCYITTFFYGTLEYFVLADEAEKNTNVDLVNHDTDHDIGARSPYDASYHDFVVGNKRFDEDGYFSFLTGEKKSHGPDNEGGYWEFIGGDQWKKRSPATIRAWNMRRRRSTPDSKPRPAVHTGSIGGTRGHAMADYSALGDKRNMDWSEFVVGKRFPKRLNYDDFIVG